jgi:hypothetical protein
VSAKTFGRVKSDYFADTPWARVYCLVDERTQCLAGALVYGLLVHADAIAPIDALASDPIPKSPFG